MTFLFDIGNVLLRLHFDRFHEKILGRPDAPLPPELESIKEPYETGYIDDREFVERSLEVIDTPLSHDEFAAAWLDIFSPNDPMWQVVRQLKDQRHRLILFSNTNNLHTSSFLKRYEVFDHFDHHHFSQVVKAMKPSPDFYRKAIEQYQIDPAETLYLDDLAENIETGRQHGFRSWQYDLDDHESCLEWLAGEGVTFKPNT